MEERVERELLVDVDAKPPPRVHRELGGLAGGDGIDGARVGGELLGAVDVADGVGCALGDGGEVGEPCRDERQPEIDHLGPGAAVGPLRPPPRPRA